MDPYIYGLSYGAAIKNISNLWEVKNLDINLLEIPACSQGELEALAVFSTENSLKLGLHIPSQYLIEQHSFILDFKTPDQVLAYVNSVATFLERYSTFEYLVAHFPLHSFSISDQEKIYLNQYFHEEIKKVCSYYHIRLFIENVAVSPCLYSPTDYLPYLDTCGFCFDIGHAHTLPYTLSNVEDKNYVSEFFLVCGKPIKSVHLYNAPFRSTKQFKAERHYPFIQDQFNPEDGFMEFGSISLALRSLPKLKYIIFEPHREEYLMYNKIGERI